MRDLSTAPISERLRATLGFIRKMTLEPEALTAGDTVAVLRAHVTEDALRDAIMVAFHFNLIDRVADALGFDQRTAEEHRNGARSLIRFGYAFPGPLRLLARRPTW